MDELKPCPFCGRIPMVDDCGDHRFFVRCKCGINQDKLYWQKCDAIRSWNRRKNIEKSGRWELKKYKLSKGDEIAYYQCSCCDHATWSIDGWMYCPYCGAKMEKSDETD